jgi:hypothetical protein
MNLKYLGHCRQIAEALEPIRTQTITSLSQVLTDAGRDETVLMPDSDGEIMTRAHQMLSMVAMFAQPPRYIPSSEIQKAFGYILAALNGPSQPQVDEMGAMFMQTFPDLALRAGFLAGVVYGAGCGEVQAEPWLKVISAVLELMGLSTQQVVAMSFNDSRSVNELQQKKLQINQTLRSTMLRYASSGWRPPGI